jgi:hypothetical protein
MAWFEWTDGMGKYFALGERILELSDDPTQIHDSWLMDARKSFLDSEEDSQLFNAAAAKPQGKVGYVLSIDMRYIRRDESTARKYDAQVVYADAETEKMLLEAGFVKAPGAPYYNYMGSAVDVIVYDDSTWEPNRGTGFLTEEWQKMRQFAGVQLKDFVAWLKQNYEFIDKYCANLKPDDYRKEETFTFVKVYKDHTPPFGGEYVWFIQHFGLLGSDGVIPADKKAIPRQYWFISGKYYESTFAFAATGIPNQVCLNQTPDLEREMSDPYVIEKIKDAFVQHTATF